MSRAVRRRRAPVSVPLGTLVLALSVLLSEPARGTQGSAPAPTADLRSRTAAPGPDPNAPENDPAAEAAAPLELDEVLASSARAVPKILEARAKARAAAAKVQGELGAFDRRLEQRLYTRPSGYYDGRQYEARVIQPLRDFGAEVEAGYRISDGGFPVYEDEWVTLPGGEWSVGVKFPLWADRTFDDARFALRTAELERLRAELRTRATALDVQHAATRAYWNWVARGRELAILDRLLRIARDRDAAFRAQFEQGDIARIEVTENAQNLLKRQALVREALQGFRIAATDLSFYLRDAQGVPRAPVAERLPRGFPEEPPGYPDPGAAVREALARQPALALLEREGEQLRARVRLARNDLDPTIDLGVKLAHDVGSGSPTRDGAELVAELTFALPLQRRQARGDLNEARAELERLSYTRQQLEENLALEVARVLERLRATHELAELTQAEADQAAVLEEAEWTRFREGASSFFVLNVREQNTADARLRTVEARLRYFLAQADLRRVTADAAALGLTEAPEPTTGAAP